MPTDAPLAAPAAPTPPLDAAIAHTRAREVLDCLNGAEYLLQDLPRWMKPGRGEADAQFLRLWATRQEFRSVLRYRVKRWADPAVGKPFGLLTAKGWMFVQNLYLSCKEIGPGLYIEHGFSSIVFAHRIGQHFRLNQNVTVGAGKGGKPTIGDHVSIYTGAVVIGPITLGDRVRVGANAVVHTDIPADCTVVPMKARVIQRPSPRAGEVADEIDDEEAEDRGDD
jgi:serine O-acetyltransferase